MRKSDLARKLIVATILAVVTAVTVAPSTPALAESLTGTVLASDETPLAGLTVYLVHPVKGRSSPVYTDRSGTFRLRNVPPVADSYYLEIYWGSDLVFRDRQHVVGDVELSSPIVLGG